MKKYKTGYFEIDHPILYFILTILISIGIALLLFIAIGLFIFITILPQNNCYKGNKIFDYEDMNGNIGTAYNCQYSDRSYRSGGQGQPICFVDNKTIAVKWYEDKTKYGNCAKIMFGGKNE